MATNNKVFVSPGVYTSEVDLSFVAQSVGVTTLGLVGETLKGPAFEPVLITNFDEFKTYFGTTSPVKYGDGNPKYELPYVAKSYLQQSNQLFVTRVLGLTGYKPYKTFGIKTIGGVLVQNDDVIIEETGSGGGSDLDNWFTLWCNACISVFIGIILVIEGVRKLSNEKKEVELQQIQTTS